MAIIIGVKFRTPGKVYYFDPGELPVKYGDSVIVETARGTEFGKVVLPIREVPDEEIKQPLKEVLRIATAEDEEREKTNREKEENAFRICQEKIRAHELPMKLVSAEYTFDNSKLLFYFTADGRIDFRDLVKDLAGIFRTRIELRQVGVRDETRIMGGIGTCGRPLCCATFLHEFAPVSIRMAKEQNLSLNPSKISGTCGRLMCCLKNEQETYEYLNKGLPRKGDYATTPDGYTAEVQSVNILRQTVRVIVDLENDEKEARDYPVSEITFISKKAYRKKEEKNEAPREARSGEKHGNRAEEKRTERQAETPAAQKTENADISGRTEPADGQDEKKPESRRSRRGRRQRKEETAGTPEIRESAESAGSSEDASDKPKRRRRRRRHPKSNAENGGAKTEPLS